VVVAVVRVWISIFQNRRPFFGFMSTLAGRDDEFDVPRETRLFATRGTRFERNVFLFLIGVRCCLKILGQKLRRASTLVRYAFAYVPVFFFEIVALNHDRGRYYQVCRDRTDAKLRALRYNVRRWGEHRNVDAGRCWVKWKKKYTRTCPSVYNFPSSRYILIIRG